VTFTGTPGVSYDIMVDGFEFAEADFQITATCLPAGTCAADSAEPNQTSLQAEPLATVVLGTSLSFGPYTAAADDWYSLVADPFTENVFTLTYDNTEGELEAYL